MTTIERHLDFAAAPEFVFDVIADLNYYGWLPPSGD